MPTDHTRDYQLANQYSFRSAPGGDVTIIVVLPLTSCEAAVEEGAFYYDVWPALYMAHNPECAEFAGVETVRLVPARLYFEYHEK